MNLKIYHLFLLPMKPFFFFLFLMCGLLLSADAQLQDKKYTVSLGPELLFPVGSTAEVNGISPAVSLRGSYRIMPQLHVTLSGAAVSVSAAKLFKELWEPWYQTSFKNSMFFPVKGGARYYFTERFYAAAEAGASIPKDAFRDVSFAYEAGIGTIFKLSERSAIDVAAKYEAWALNTKSVTSFAGFRAAYSFGF